MKEKDFDNYEVLKKEVENLKKQHKYFFVDAREGIIYTPNENENFLSFYLDIFAKVVNHNNNEFTAFTTTNLYFYTPSSFAQYYGCQNIQIMMDKLGYNFDDYDLEFTDKIGVIY